MRLKSIVWKCLQRQRFFCRRMTSFTMFTYSLRDTARFWLSRRGCRFESASKLDTLPLLTLKSKSKTFIEPDRLRIHYRAHVPIKQVGLRMAVIKAKDDSIGFHSTDSRQPNQMVHSFPDRRGHGRFEKSFNLDHTRANHHKWKLVIVRCNTFNPPIKSIHAVFSAAVGMASVSVVDPIFT